MKTMLQLSKQCAEKAAGALVSALTILVFAFLDVLDFILCVFYRVLDELLDENGTPCYCHRSGGCEGGQGLSETLYVRKSFCRGLGLFRVRRVRENGGKVGSSMKPRWSDCSCDACVSWQENGEDKLHYVVLEPTEGNNEGDSRKAVDNVIFLHGFLSSSLYWTETVFPNLSESARTHYRLFAVDLLGFGKSPKPRDCSYTLDDHITSIQRSVIEPLQLNSMHLVAHSMGCIIALAIAAKYPNHVKSIALIAPPYFSSSEERVSHTVLNTVAKKKLWPPVVFGSSVMSWYEHVGRTICFIVCRNHRKWEWILKLLSSKRKLPVTVIDLTRHTHHSGWHTMHNVICGGALVMDDCLAVVNNARIGITLIHGDKDQVVPLECSYNLKQKVPFAKFQLVSSADHTTVVLTREKDLTRDLELIWSSSVAH